MRVLMTTQPGLGSLHPMIPLAHRLQAAGHTVAFACSRSFGHRVESAGIPVFPAGLDWQESETEQLFPQVNTLSLKDLQFWYLTEVFADIAAHRMLPDLVTICQAWQPDIIVRNDFEFSACVAAEYLGIPQATLGIDTFLSPGFLKARIGEQLAYLRSTYRLPAYPAVDMLYPYLYLSFMPPSYQGPEFAQLPVAHSFRPLVFDQSGHESLPDWVATLPYRPTVCVTLGTVLNRLPDIFTAILAGLRDEPINLILTIGSNQDPSQFGPQPPHVHIVRYIPHTLLFPHCDLVITSGSVGTVKSLLFHAIPMVLIPLFATQPVHAIHSARQGAGIILKYGGILDDQPGADTWPELTPASVRTAVRELLNNPCYRANAQRLREELLALPGPEKAVDRLMRLATERTPQVAVVAAAAEPSPASGGSVKEAYDNRNDPSAHS